MFDNWLPVIIFILHSLLTITDSMQWHEYLTQGKGSLMPGW